MLVFSLGLAPSHARMGGAPFARPGLGFGHFQHFAPRGFNRRFDFDRFGFNRFRFNRFDRFGANRFGRFGFNRFNRFGFDGFGGWGGWGWDGWGGVPVSNGASEPIIVGDGAPSSSISAPIRSQAAPAPRTREAVSSISLPTTATANMSASGKALCAD
jgi:hypothetical protein